MVEPSEGLSGLNAFPNSLTNAHCMNWQICLKQTPWPGFFVLALMAQIAAAQPPAPTSWPAEAIIRFSATSTMHDFEGEVPAQPFVLIVSSNAWSAEADVLSALMGTGSKGRDKNMHEMLNTNDQPRIHGRVATAPKPDAGSTNATLSLKILEQQHDLPVQISSWSETDGTLSFHAEWELSLKQYKLKPPSVLGIIRVGDTVRLNADVTASKKPPLTNPPAASNVPATKQ
jgi:hypothetical protein